jgi:sulfur-carrier protein adenylyltransferase/sulfurtransferase
MAFKTYADLVTEAKQRIKEVTPQDAIAMQGRGEPMVIIDCREANEWNLGHVPRAVFMPRGVLESNVERAARRDQKVIIYCASGNRSALAADVLMQMGYADVASMSRGIRGWVEEGGELEE